MIRAVGYAEKTAVVGFITTFLWYRKARYAWFDFCWNLLFLPSPFEPF